MGHVHGRYEAVGEATQVQFPTITTVRTFLQAWLPSLVGFVLVLPEILQILLDDIGPVLPEGARLWLAGVATVVAAVAAALARIMAIQKVNAALRKIGIGAPPAVAGPDVPGQVSPTGGS